MKQFITILLLTLSLNTYATEDPGDGDGVTSEVPVDGGISLLLVAGAAFAGRKLYRKGGK